MNRLFSAGGFAALALGTLALSFAGGCRSEPVKYDETTVNAADQFRRIAVAYNKAAQKKRGKGVTAEDLKPFLKEDGDPDKVLVSPLDGKPIVIVPGVTSGTDLGDDEQAIVAYEQTGVNGKRMTVDIRATVVIMSDDEFAQVKFVGGHKPVGQ